MLASMTFSTMLAVCLFLLKPFSAQIRLSMLRKKCFKRNTIQLSIAKISQKLCFVTSFTLYRNSPKSNRGFTLVELSISFSILALLLTGAAAMMNKKIESDRSRITLERMKTIDDAISSFAAINSYIPCAAPGNGSETAVNFGRGNLTGTVISTTGTTQGAAGNVFTSSNSALVNFSTITAGSYITVSGFTNARNNGRFYVTAVTATQLTVLEGLITEAAGNSITVANEGAGMVPVRTLGLDDNYAFDGWGRKFTYRAATGMCSASDMADPSFRGDIRVTDIKGNEKTDFNRQPQNNMGAAYVLISHGANGNSTHSNIAQAIGGSITKEEDNRNHSTDSIYVQDTKSLIFDDIVSFKLKSDLNNYRYGASPVRFSSSTCGNAKKLIENGAPRQNNTSSNLYTLSTVSSAKASLANQIYDSSKALALLCDNQPTSCALSPFSVAGDNLALWLDADDPLGSGVQPVNGKAISQWMDKSGNGYIAEQSTAANQPTYTVANTTAPSQRPVVHFDGTNDTLAVKNFTLGTQMSIFAVGKFTTGSGHLFIELGPNANSSDGFYFYGAGGSAIRITNNGQNLIVNAVNWLSNSFLLADGVYDGSTAQTFCCGGFSSSTTSATLFNDSVTDTLNIGSRNGTSVLISNGDLAEVIIYNRALTTTERQLVESYLNWKWFNQPCPSGYGL